jgi:hypothetical protein
MKRPPRKWLIIGTCAFLVVIGAMPFFLSTPREPKYGGKKLSVWVNELVAMDGLKRRDTSLPQIQAVRAIGTNALPWLMGELNTPFSGRRAWLNQMLAKQHVVKYRFDDVQVHWQRGCAGIEALGDLAAPVIPDLLALVDRRIGYVPGALAAIGPPAIPALQQCLTNTHAFGSSTGTYAPIPGQTIGAIANAIYAGRLSRSEASVFLPAIREWAQSTNRSPAQYNYAADYLREFDKPE